MEGAAVSTPRSRAVQGLGLRASGNFSLTPKLGASTPSAAKESKAHHLRRGHLDSYLLPDDFVTTPSTM